MPAKPAASARAGSSATKRRVKSTAKRQYPPPKNMMIRAPSGPAVVATVEDTVSEEDSDDSDDSDTDTEDSASDSESMQVDEDTGEKVTTGRPLGRATEKRMLKTTRYEYAAATLTMKDGGKHRVVPGSCLIVNFFDETAEDQVLPCPALVRTIFSVEKNNPRDRGLNGEALPEEVNHDGVLLGVSWLLDVPNTQKLDGGKNYKPPYDIPTNERFYDPRTWITTAPSHVTRSFRPSCSSRGGGTCPTARRTRTRRAAFCS